MPSEVVSSRTPSLVQVGLLPQAAIEDHQSLVRAAVSAFCALHGNGSSGCHIDLPLSAVNTRSVYQELGFVAVPTSPGHTLHTTLARPI